MSQIGKSFSKNKRLIQLLTLVLFAFVLYWPCIGTYFFADDLMELEGNRGLLDSADAFLSTFTEGGIHGGGGHSYRPVYRLSLAITNKFFGLNPTIYHIQNVVVHGLVAILVYAFALTLTHRTRVAYLSGLFFVTHYVFINTTAFITGRGREYGLMFSLIAILMYIKWRRTDPNSCLNYVLSVLTYLLAMLSIDEAIMLAALLAAYEVFFHPQEHRCRSSWLSLAPFVLTAIFYLAVRKATGTMMPHFGESGYTFAVGFNIISNAIYYIVYLISPIDIYPFIPFLAQLQADIACALGTGALEWGVWVAASLSALVGAVLVLRRVDGTVGFLLLWIVLYLMPPIMLHHPSSAYLAVPSAGYAILLSIGLCNLVEYSKKQDRRWIALVSYTLIAIVLGGYSISTFRGNILINEKGDTAKYIISQVKAKYPTFQDGPVLYFANEVDPKTYSFIGLYGVRVFETYSIGPSFRMVYANPSLNAHIVSLNDLKRLASQCHLPCGKYFFVYRRDGSVDEIKPGKETAFE